MQIQPNQQLPDPASQPTNPLHILHRELKDKNLKKSALQSITTISLTLGRKKTRQQLIPYLGNIFVQQSTDMQKLILKGLSQLLHPIYIGKSHHSRIILELIIDVLCVFSNKEIREEAYACLEKVFAVIDVRKAQNMLVDALLRLSQEEEEIIRQLVLKMIPYVYAGADGDRQVELLKLLNNFKSKPSDKKLLSQMLKDFIKVMPPAPETQIRQIISLLIQSGDKVILSNLIQPVILLARVSGGESTVQYLTKIFQQADSSVFCTALRKYWDLSQVFAEQSLQTLHNKIKEYDSQPQQIKNMILQLLDSLPIPQQQVQKLGEPPSSLQLKTTLSDTLCRVNDIKGLQKLFNSSDPNFQVKLFPKLPPISNIHIEIVQKIMVIKSWRQKLTIIQNIEYRTEKGESTDILIDKLRESMGDKIACIRVAVTECIKNIMIKHKISISQVQNLVEKILGSKNWFERQSLYRMMLDLVQQSPFHMSQKQEISRICKKAEAQKAENNKLILLQIQQFLSNK